MSKHGRISSVKKLLYQACDKLLALRNTPMPDDAKNHLESVMKMLNESILALSLAHAIVADENESEDDNE